MLHTLENSRSGRIIQLFIPSNPVHPSDPYFSLIPMPHRRTGFIPAAPYAVVFFSNRISDVSTWSSMWWPSAMILHPVSRIPADKSWYLARRDIFSAAVTGYSGNSSVFHEMDLLICSTPIPAAPRAAPSAMALDAGCKLWLMDSETTRPGYAAECSSICRFIMNKRQVESGPPELDTAGKNEEFWYRQNGRGSPRDWRHPVGGSHLKNAAENSCDVMGNADFAYV